MDSKIQMLAQAISLVVASIRCEEKKEYFLEQAMTILFKVSLQDSKDESKSSHQE